MKDRIYLVSLFFAFLLCIGINSVYSFEKSVVLGRGDRWRDVIELYNVSLVKGRYGDYDLVLRDAEYNLDKTTDLLLHFNSPSPYDKANRYECRSKDLMFSNKYYRYGSGSGGFLKKHTQLELIPSSRSMFWPGRIWGDFSIEFWMYPANLEDGEKIIFWTNVVNNEKEVFYQQIKCYIERRHLKWEFVNFFISPDFKKNVVLKGLKGLIPRTWSHHLIRFNSSSGLFEYLVDGRVEDVKYITRDGRGNSEVIVPYLAGRVPANLLIGQGFTGFLDELRFKEEFVRDVILTKYSGKTGFAITRIMDLGYSDTDILQIDGVYDKPSDSDIYFYYRVSNVLKGNENLTGKWVRFLPGKRLDGIKGRYIQLRFELFPDGKRIFTPSVSQLSVVYEPNLPPASPTGLYAIAGDGRVHLYWQRVNEADVKGYLIYYGDLPGSYLGSGANEGDSPIDVGNTDNFTITGLENGKLYSFSVVAYDSSRPRHLSGFSNEITVRPSRIKE